MAAFAYCDNSQTRECSSTRWQVIGGILGDKTSFDGLENSWNRTLDHFQLRYFHMSEFTVSAHNTPFERLKGDEGARAEILTKFVDLICDRAFEISLVRGICGSLIRSSGAGRVGLGSRRTRCRWDVGFFRSQLPFEPIWPPGESYVVFGGQ